MSEQAQDSRRPSRQMGGSLACGGGLMQSILQQVTWSWESSQSGFGRNVHLRNDAKGLSYRRGPLVLLQGSYNKICIMNIGKPVLLGLQSKHAI